MFRDVNNDFAGMRRREGARLGDELGRMLGKRANRYLGTARLNKAFSWITFGLGLLVVILIGLRLSNNNRQDTESNQEGMERQSKASKPHLVDGDEDTP